MAREVTHTERGPYRLTPDDIDEKYGDVAICQCGLSDDLPFCDGSHRRTEDEEPGVVYRYVDGERHVVRTRSEVTEPSDEADETNDSEDSDETDDSEDSDETDDSDDSDETDDSDDSDETDDSDDSDETDDPDS